MDPPPSTNAPLGEAAQPLAVQASQQLDLRPTQAEPPLGAVQELIECLVLQVVLPFEFVRQQVTKPALPQVDCAAHFTTAPLQLLLSRVAFACPAAHGNLPFKEH